MLKETQEWFASIITCPIDLDSRIQRVTPSGGNIEEEAERYILPSSTLKPYQRIEIYHQQYWWRLLSNLHESFPLVTRLFGYAGFNQLIGIPFLQSNPPNHWSLNHLGDRLPKWVEEFYLEKDKKLILNAAKIDMAYNDAFFETHFPPVAQCDAAVLNKKLFLQPHVHLFSFPYDLFTFRKEFLNNDPDYWVENDFPKLIKGNIFYFILFRKKNNFVSWKELPAAKYEILQNFEIGASIEEVCTFIEKQSRAFQEKVSRELSHWFKEWTCEGILTTEHKC